MLPSSSDHLAETAASIAALKELADVEWVLVFDGPGAETVAVPEADVIVHLPSHRGTATARNIGLVSSSGAFVHMLDGDDLVLPGILESLSALESRQELGWVAPNRVFLDGSKTVHWHGPKDWAAGELAEHWTTPFPFHPNSAVYRRSAVFLAGGVPSISPGDDMALMLMVSERSPGVSSTEVATAYRVWPKQAVQSIGFYERAVRSRKFIEECLNGRRLAEGKAPVVASAPAQQSLSVIRVVGSTIETVSNYSLAT